MRPRDLDRELADAGFQHIRNGGKAHRIYADAAGHTLTVASHGGARHSFCRAELVAIRRTVQRLVALDDPREAG